jgi:uncharacterized protein (DUF342 family)
LKNNEQLIAIRNSGAYQKGYEFRVNKNKTEGYIRPISEKTQPLSLEDIAEIINITGIRYGLKKTDQLKEELLKTPNPKESWIIARGDLPRPRNKATIAYHFDIDPMKIGTLKKTGYMDYKDRGRIPQVKEGTLVAEKILGEEGQPGTDIFGQPVPPPRIRDLKLRYGKGIKLSKDGMRATAKTDGRPVLSSNGRVHVFEELQIEGDIGIRTGHVDFDGRIEVEGIVNDGYRVKGGSLCTQEIHMAQVDIVGDVIVLGGINGSRLKVGGNLRARYIHQSTIQVKGDVIVDRDLSNSTITSGGTVIVDNGKVLTSTISARHGIKAVDIGSKMSPTCALTVGLNQEIQDIIEKTKAEIKAKETHQKELDKKIEDLRGEIKELDQSLTSALNVYAGVHQKRTTLVEQVKSSPPKFRNKLYKLNAQIAYLKETLDRSKATIAKLKDDQTVYIDRLESNLDEMSTIEESVSMLKDKIRETDEFSQIKEGEFARTPVVQVLGTIHSGTKIQGPHASLEISRDHQRAKIMETRTDEKENDTRWRMVVKPHR